MTICSRKAALALDWPSFCCCEACKALGAQSISDAAKSRARALRKIYQHTPKDYRSSREGQRFIMIWRDGTALVPLDSLTDTEMLDRLGSALRAEANRR
nr:hypothetical protein [uncultured Halomonas sp.]